MFLNFCGGETSGIASSDWDKQWIFGKRGKFWYSKVVFLKKSKFLPLFSLWSKFGNVFPNRMSVKADPRGLGLIRGHFVIPELRENAFGVGFVPFRIKEGVQKGGLTFSSVLWRCLL